jgi:hypothetical protein
VIPDVIQLHGYGEPLLDKNIPEYVDILTKKDFYTYFSCNPANIDLEKMERMFKNGLTHIKFSVESTDDAEHKEIRGEASDFTKSYQKILEVMEMKEREVLDTNVVITMLDLNREEQEEDYERLVEVFKDEDVYIYFKSQDTQWLNKDTHGTKSIHWTEPCRHPWMSMTIKSNGEACQCMEDFNNAIVLGDTKTESLYDIWNGEKYERFRKAHMEGAKGLQCGDRCDMQVGHV